MRRREKVRGLAWPATAGQGWFRSRVHRGRSNFIMRGREDVCCLAWPATAGRCQFGLWAQNRSRRNLAPIGPQGLHFGPALPGRR